MAENVAAKLSIDVEARLDRLEKGMKQAEVKARKAAKKIEDASNKGSPFSGIVDKALRAVAVMGTLELGVGAVNVGVKALSGNIEDAAAAVEQLPAGIGPFARQLKELLGTITGIGDEIERINKSRELGERLIDFGNDLLKSRQGTLETTRAISQALQQEAELIGKTASERIEIAQRRERDAMRAQFDAQVAALAPNDAQQKVVNDIRQQLNELEAERNKQQQIIDSRRGMSEAMRASGGGREVYEANQRKKTLDAEIESLQSRIRSIIDTADAEKQIEAERASAIEALSRLQEQARREFEQKETEAAAQAEKRRQDEIDRERQKQEQLAKQEQQQYDRREQERLARADRLASVDSQIRQQQLRAADRLAEAEAEAIRESFRSQIESAERAGDEMLSAKLRMLRDIEIAQRRADARQQKGSAAQVRRGTTGDTISQADASRRGGESQLMRNAQLAANRDRRQRSAEYDRQAEASRLERERNAMIMAAERATLPGPQSVGQGDVATTDRTGEVVRALQENNTKLDQLIRGIVG
jgi:hypothetical protein